MAISLSLPVHRQSMMVNVKWPDGFEKSLRNLNLCGVMDYLLREYSATQMSAYLILKSPAMLIFILVYHV